MNILYVPLITFISTFLFQIIIIFVLKKRKKTKELTPEEEYKMNIRFAIKILIVLIISTLLSICSFFGSGIYVLYELRKGH